MDQVIPATSLSYTALKNLTLLLKKNGRFDLLISLNYLVIQSKRKLEKNQALGLDLWMSHHDFILDIYHVNSIGQNP